MTNKLSVEGKSYNYYYLFENVTESICAENGFIKCHRGAKAEISFSSKDSKQLSVECRVAFLLLARWNRAIITVSVSIFFLYLSLSLQDNDMAFAAFILQQRGIRVN